jgi:phosphohistidine phosphatase
MELLLWRHADAEEGYPDAARELTPRGHEQAALSARWLQARLPKSYRLLVSPAARAQQTAQALDERRMETEPRIGVGASATDILKAAGWGKAAAAREPDAVTIVVGHQPTLGQVAALLLSGSQADWPIKKSSVWWFSEREGSVRLRAVLDPKLG